MEDNQSLFQERMSEEDFPSSNDPTIPKGMTSSTSNFLCSSHLVCTHTGCEPTPTTALEAQNGPHYKSQGPASSAVDNTTSLQSSKWYNPPSILVNSSTMSFSTTSSAVAVLMCLLITFLASPSTAFNLDLKTAVIHEGRKGSMFGYSVAQHVDQSTNWLLIGAPKAQTRQRDVVKGGAVYRCKTDSANACQIVPFDSQGNNIRYNRSLNDYLPIEQKSNQWFGATLQSSGESGVIVACAPRYIYFGIDLQKREPVGMCWVAKTSTTEYESYSPCAKAVDRSVSTDQYHRQGFCHFGLSATFSNDGRRLMIAAPGSWYWQGQLYNYKTDERGRIFSKTPEGNETEDNQYMGQMFVYDAETGKPRFTNKEGDTDTDYGYRGYSSAMGKFDSDNEYDYVVGIPRGDNYVGMIEFYTQNMTLLGSISGEQIGAYFGGAVAVTDLNGDRKDDIIVGAPFYTNFELTDSFEAGRVYIYYQTSSHSFKANRFDILDGVTSQSRFGMAVGGLGDINYDGYMDLCVGAPYAGENGKGAIYVFLGSTAGIITEPSQIIYATDFKSPLAAFGSSISAGTDQDGNYYPDVLIGAYESDKAVFMRTRPIVKVRLSLELHPKRVNLETKNCSLNGTRVTCLEVHSCLYYEGRGVPNELYFDLKWHLDAKEGNNSNAAQRAFFNKSQPFVEKKAVNITKKDTHCISLYAYVRSDLADKLSPIKTVFDFKLNLEEEEKRSRLKRDLQPILDSNIRTDTSFTVEILNNCGEDNICTPDLYVLYVPPNEYIAGDSTELEVRITVGNKGEDAFNSKLFIEMPPGVDYNGIDDISSEVTISCDPLAEGSQFVVCNLGNPMTNKSVSAFTFKAKPPNATFTRDTLKFLLHVNSSNPEADSTYRNNQVYFDIKVITDVDFKFLGAPNPREFNATQKVKQDDGKGKLVRHKFVLKSVGVSLINEIELYIEWPSRDTRGHPVLTLDGELIISGNGKCTIKNMTPNNAFNLRDYPNEGYPVYNPGSKKRTQDIRCTYHYCTIISCTVGFTTENPEFILTVNSRLKVGNFLQSRDDLDDVDKYNLLSVSKATVKSLPYDFKNIDLSKVPVKKLDLKTTLRTTEEESEGVAAWIYAVAISVGILLLLILILLLWCCGFFKRKKPEDDEGYFAVNGKNDIDNKYVD